MFQIKVNITINEQKCKQLKESETCLQGLSRWITSHSEKPFVQSSTKLDHTGSKVKKVMKSLGKKLIHFRRETLNLLYFYVCEHERFNLTGIRQYLNVHAEVFSAGMVGSPNKWLTGFHALITRHVSVHFESTYLYGNWNVYIVTFLCG